MSQPVRIHVAYGSTHQVHQFEPERIDVWAETDTTASQRDKAFDDLQNWVVAKVMEWEHQMMEIRKPTKGKA